MFVLRSIWNGKNPVFNQSIGNLYTLHYKESDENWDANCRELGLTKESKENCFGFLRCDGGPIALFYDVEYYVMTESGKTFERLTINK